MPESPEDLSPAIAGVVARFADMVRNVALTHGLAGDDLDEVIQQVRIRIWHAHRDGGKIAALGSSYMYRTAVSAAVDLIRARRARMEEGLETAEGDAIRTSGPVHLLERAELAEQMALAVDGLIESRRPVVRMYLRGYAHPEIARILGWSEARTRHLLYRGLEDLRRRLLAMGIAPEATT